LRIQRFQHIHNISNIKKKERKIKMVLSRKAFRNNRFTSDPVRLMQAHQVISENSGQPSAGRPMYGLRQRLNPSLSFPPLGAPAALKLAF
jgi:hypothetical protein